MAFDPAELTPEMIEFVTVRHLATLTTQRRDGSPHVVPVGFSYDPADRRVRIISGPGSQKARNAARGSVGLVCQVEGGRWLTLEGRCELRTDEESLAKCGAGYEARYGHPPRREGWASLEIVVSRCFGRA